MAAASIAGLATALLTAATDRPHYAPAAGWIATAVVYLVWTWAVIRRMDPAATRQHAIFNERDGTRHLSHAIIVLASLTSLAGVVFLLYATSGDKPDLAAGLVGVMSVLSSWFAIHTVYTLRYARMFYTAPDPQQPGMNFDGDPPAYLDFAYVAFAIGMCYSVPDIGLTNRRFRTSVMSHATVSYLFATFFIAMTVNLVGGL
ncbi:MAG: DUF1345 domain-containing protein [Mycobacterium sp.]|nr:DUF1345 domain-containing protein [Mycobacterium sp.]